MNFKPNPNFERELASSPQIEQPLRQKLEQMAESAREIAPVGTSAEGDRHPGEYRDSIATEIRTGASGKVGVLEANAPHSRYVEAGTIHNPPFHVLSRAAEMAANENR